MSNFNHNFKHWPKILPSSAPSPSPSLGLSWFYSQQGVILPTGVRAFPAGNLETLQEILHENHALLSHFEFCGQLMTGKKPLIFNVHWIYISLVHHFICNREQWLIITVSSPSYRPYKQENNNGYFDISRKWISKPGNMEAFLPGKLPESEEVYRIFKNIR